MTSEQQRLLNYLDKVLAKIEDIICDNSVPQGQKDEIYSAEIAILSKFSLVKE